MLLSSVLLLAYSITLTNAVNSQLLPTLDEILPSSASELHHYFHASAYSHPNLTKVYVSSENSELCHEVITMLYEQMCTLNGTVKQPSNNAKCNCKDKFVSKRCLIEVLKEVTMYKDSSNWSELLECSEVNQFDSTSRIEGSFYRLQRKCCMETENYCEVGYIKEQLQEVCQPNQCYY